MRTQIAMRHLLPDPVDDELLLHLVDLAIRAPSGKNKQKWEFIFLQSDSKKAQVGSLNRTPIKLIRPFLRDKESKMVKGFLNQADRFQSAPVVCVPCIWGWPTWGPLIYTSSLFGSIYPAIQNFMLASRAAGLGTTLTTVGLWNTPKLRKIIGAPWNLTPVCIIPLGWPAKKFVKNVRLPAAEATHFDSFERRRP